MKLSLLLPLCFLIFSVAESLAKDAKQRWLDVDIGIIGTASQDVLHSAMQDVADGPYDGLLVTLDTPGGALDATRAMVKEMMDAKFPVVVWVGPSGSRAASAGAFITIAGHVASMAPGTNIGAAHPIQASGKDIDEGSHAAKKVEQDTAAFIESIAKERGRNAEMAVSFVLTSIAITAEEALKQNVIDHLAKSREELFAKLDGSVISLSNGTKITLATSRVKFDKYKRTIKQDFLEILSNPNLFYLLFIAGLIGIGFELTHPGSLFPGVVGAICMVLALIATSVLPVSFGAMLLVLAGMALMLAEIYLPSLGVLGIGGFVAFCIGSFLLVDPGNEQGLRISLSTIIPGVTAVGLASLGIGYLVLKTERLRVQAGSETLVGDTGPALSSFREGQGQVRIQGEIWQARCTEPIAEGDVVKVLKVDGLTLDVSKNV